MGKSFETSRIQKLAFVKGKVILAIDIGKNFHWCRLRFPDGTLSKPWKICNHGHGLALFWSQLPERLKGYSIELLVVGFESTSVYWKPLAYFLLEHHVKMVLLFTASTKKARGMSDDSPEKSDKKDTILIADLISQAQFTWLHLPTGAAAQLRQLNADREYWKTRVREHKSHAFSLLDQLFPEWTQVFKDPWTKSSMALLQKVGLPELCKEANKNELVDILVRVSRQKKGAEKKITTLQKLAEQSAGVKHAGQALWKCLSRAVLQIQALEASLQELEQEMLDALEPVPYADNLTSLKDLGLTAAAALVGELGGIENYDHVEQAYKMAGLNLYQVTSGSQEVEEKKIKRKITKRGRSRLRKILYFAALRCVKKDGCFRKYYEHLLAKGKHKEVALVAVCRKLLRVLFSLVKNNTRFDPSQHQSQGVERN